MALMPVMMSIFVVLVLAPDFIISNPTDRELFFVWEIAYLAGGLLSSREKQDKGRTASAFACWIIVFPIVVILSFLWADIRIHDGFGGLAHFIISCISWGFSIIPPYCLEYICIKSIVRMPNGRKILFMLGLREYGDRLIVQFV